ncbi:MAG: DNA-binding protein [Candidatus Handelsmanbacteria bacterium RIFCSPLOWO2_12_FULL_64_10]|uniref:Ribonuclease VapC n=1 Tax=Handelsmanbacteria sp. (strain RIFCSPLOWO2_12_FULL_64_10) TaxID=1817868 RepID=A0A1F6C7C6_HANXR|nr:MAG: DNA-binding protein [Candidatus Handelsmanbacteria bacterium RIFCSPLOWO2_12_FULL_64_10]
MAIFVDTGAWFAYFVRRDPDHTAAMEWIRQNRQPLMTTDYVLDELLTLLKLRESHRIAVAAGERLWQRRIARIEHITDEDIRRAWEVFRQYHDKDWSFTDCTSKVVIERLRIAQAFAFDSHFEQFGTVVRRP